MGKNKKYTAAELMELYESTYDPYDLAIEDEDENDEVMRFLKWVEQTS